MVNDGNKPYRFRMLAGLTKVAMEPGFNDAKRLNHKQTVFSSNVLQIRALYR
jgi:hypothetical protein